MLPFKMKNGKRKPRRFSVTHLLLAHCAKGSLSPICQQINKRKFYFLMD